MASAAEQLASNMNMQAFSKAKDLHARLWFVVFALIIYRLGTYVPLPGVDPQVWGEIFNQKGGGILDMFNVFSGGALSRMSIFALNIIPYISASIIVQMATSMIPQLEQMKKEGGETARQKINQYARYLTVILACVQAYGLSVGLESMQGASGPAVIEPGAFFRFTTIITIVCGTVFLMWLGEQITQRGIGNGTSLLIFAGIVAGLPGSFISVLELGRQGQFSVITMLAFLLGTVAIIAFIVYVERAQRRIPVQYPKRQVGNRQYQGQSTHLPLKINTAGVIPPIFASSILLLPLTIIGFVGAGNDAGWLTDLSRLLSHGQPLYMALYGALIVFFCFFYTSIVFNPKENADMLKKNGGFVPGIRPGDQTTRYLDTVLTRLTLIGAIYMVLVCLVPEFLLAEHQIPFYFGGTSLLIVVTVTIDTVTQIQSHMVAHQYEGLIKKARAKGQIK
jgi:preprotein translocase subunit SecY